MHRTLTAVLFGFSLLMTGQAFAAPSGTTIYWIDSDFCHRCSSGGCPVIPKGQLYESPSLTDLFRYCWGAGPRPRESKCMPAYGDRGTTILLVDGFKRPLSALQNARS